MGPTQASKSSGSGGSNTPTGGRKGRSVKGYYKKDGSYVAAYKQRN